MVSRTNLMISDENQSNSKSKFKDFELTSQSLKTELIELIPTLTTSTEESI